MADLECRRRDRVCGHGICESRAARDFFARSYGILVPPVSEGLVKALRESGIPQGFKKGKHTMKIAFKFFLVLCIAFAGTAAFAQDVLTKGSIAGQVVDASGGAVPGAT